MSEMHTDKSAISSHIIWPMCANCCAGTVAASLRGAFFDSFASYAVGTDHLSQELSAKGPPGEGGDAPEEEAAPISGERKLLVLLSNCAFVRGSVMPSLIDRCVCTPIVPFACAAFQGLNSGVNHCCLYFCNHVQQRHAQPHQ